MSDLALVISLHQGFEVHWMGWEKEKQRRHGDRGPLANRGRRNSLSGRKVGVGRQRWGWHNEGPGELELGGWWGWGLVGV